MSDARGPDPHDISALPYRVAVLCYLYDECGRLLLLHRKKEPNSDMYSPIGGKLEARLGESPHQCAQREIREEAGIEIPLDQLRMIGIVSEKAYEGRHHWLIFLFTVKRPIRTSEIARMDMDEGKLEWHDVDAVERLPIPDTDLRVMWPSVRKHHDGFFMVHIDCTKEPFSHVITESWPRM